MTFEWDDEKNAANIRSHGISFEDASRVFNGPCVEFNDDRFQYGEDRSITLGLLYGVVVLYVAHTDRAGVTRIISARRATPNERQRYEKEVFGSHDG